MYLVSGLYVPILYLWSPKWLSLQGVGPSWAVLWLLPWVLDKNKISGLFDGFCLGLLLDSISIGSASQIPALMFLGHWWSSDKRNNPPLELSLNLGLYAFLGSIISGLSIWVQICFLGAFQISPWFHGWAFHTLLSQSILTGLLAPLVCSWILLTRRAPKQAK
tara:strand:+ start:988 stop:1476 length:489 start_codon:yes stop_codon:yes gene_type:complete